MNDPTTMSPVARDRGDGDQLQSDGFALLAPVGAPAVARSSPHVMSFALFERTFGGSPRRQDLLAMLTSELQDLKMQGVRPLCLLVGGGFVRRGDAPNDLDALMVYGLDPGVSVEAVRCLQDRKKGGLDLRFVPGDVGPVPLMKMSCFFHTLYQSRDRDGEQASFIVTIER